MLKSLIAFFTSFQNCVLACLFLELSNDIAKGFLYILIDLPFVVSVPTIFLKQLVQIYEKHTRTENCKKEIKKNKLPSYNVEVKCYLDVK